MPYNIATMKSERSTPDIAISPESSARALGFRLLSMALVFTPVFPIVDYYEGVCGNVRSCYLNLSNLVVELYLGSRSYIRIVCEESNLFPYSF